jgi:hypothetical protein
VDGKNSLEVVVGQLPQQLVAQDPGIVDDHVETPCLGHGRVDDPLNRVGVAHVGDHAAGADLTDGLVEGFLVEVYEEHVGAGAGEQRADLLADSLPGAGDDHGAVGVVEGQIRHIGLPHCRPRPSRTTCPGSWPGGAQ